MFYQHVPVKRTMCYYSHPDQFWMRLQPQSFMAAFSPINSLLIRSPQDGAEMSDIRRLLREIVQ